MIPTSIRLPVYKLTYLSLLIQCPWVVAQETTRFNGSIVASIHLHVYPVMHLTILIQFLWKIVDHVL